MDDLIFSLNATPPIFIMMMLGYFLRRIGLVTQEFADAANTFVFKICLPLVLFDDLYQMDIAAAWDGGFVAFCAVATLGSIALCWLVSRAFGKQPWRGEFIQASYRSGAAFLGIAFLLSIYGEAGAAPLMVIGAVPIYNVSAVIILELMRPGKVDRGVSPELIRSTIRGIVTNPIILGILAGVAWSLLRIPMPQVLGTAVADVGGIATPLGLIALGASFSFRRAFAVGTPSIVASAIKLVGLELVFLPMALAAGYTGQKLVAVVMMLGLPSTVSGYVMARNMGYEGAVNSSVVMLTTLLSSVTITFWLWLLKSQGLV
ncbi:AEC family transporter [Paratractidigestivibacter sp.]|uniref:AEC family transporter n=1 Tax=Paratractidigestivibacter sp. TaxID=2847316 RepID=UPI003AB8896A